jgi:hypothetical protein
LDLLVINQSKKMSAPPSVQKIKIIRMLERKASIEVYVQSKNLHRISKKNWPNLRTIVNFCTQ